jgi:hypothetical protein
MLMNNIYNMTRKEFEKLPFKKDDENIGEFDSLIILPTKRKHDSGFAVMDFVAVREEIPICRLSGCSDVLVLNNINKNDDWSIDCLFKSKLFRLFNKTFHLKLNTRSPLSIFEISTD